MNYTTNTMVRIAANFNTIGGILIDPSSFTMKIRLPDNTITDLSASVVRDSIGSYYVDYIPITIGNFTYEWIGTGNMQISKLGQFEVNVQTF
jgi:hypothetical protein